MRDLSDDDGIRLSLCEFRAPEPADTSFDSVACEDARPVLHDPSMVALFRLTRRAAQGSAPLLILGETGSGKELVARFAHDQSPRRMRRFAAINCAAIPSALVESTLFGHEKGAFTGATQRAKGVFEEADGGSVFLDEIGELAPAAQAALLRVLETKRITRVGSNAELPLDVRVLAATHRDLEAMVAAGTFRADLLHRLDVVTLRVPPLRERALDIEPLALRFLQESARAWQSEARSITPEVFAALRSYAWPGNVRELRNAIERAAMACEGHAITLADLPERVRTFEPRAAAPSAPRALCEEGERAFADRVRAYEIELIRAALAETQGNQKQAAQRLAMPLRTLVYKIRAYGLRKLASTD